MQVEEHNKRIMEILEELETLDQKPFTLKTMPEEDPETQLTVRGAMHTWLFCSGIACLHHYLCVGLVQSFAGEGRRDDFGEVHPP